MGKPVLCQVAACDHRVFHKQALCKRCWRRLPRPFRIRIKDALAMKNPVQIRAAEAEAISWLTDHPASVASFEQIERVCGD